MKNYLFCNGDIFGVIEARKQQIEAHISGLERNHILSTSIEDLCKYIEDKYCFETPTLHMELAHVEQKEGMIEIYDTWRYARSHEQDGPIRLLGTIVSLTVPFTGDPQLFRVRPNPHTSILPMGDIEGNNLIITVSGKDMQPDQVKARLNEQIKVIEEYLNWQRRNTVSFNDSIREFARAFIDRRRAKLLADQNLVADLGFPLKKRDDAPQTFAAPVQRRRISPTLPAATTVPFRPEPTLTESEYRNILDIMSNMAVVMERSPSAFNSIEEEDLRQHFLVQLNGQYEGQATGETFNYGGKTDILIRVDGQNIFVAECKYWRGEKSYADTIDQIMSYLSWRDTKACIVVFNKNKDFSGVLEKIKSATDAHPLKKAGPKIENESRFRYVFGQKTDQSREVVLTILAFDVPSA